MLLIYMFAAIDSRLYVLCRKVFVHMSDTSATPSVPEDVMECIVVIREAMTVCIGVLLPHLEKPHQRPAKWK